MYNLAGPTIAMLLTIAGASAHNSTIQCFKGLKMFVSRGTGENETYFGVTESVVQNIADRIDGSDFEAIKYPAASDDSYPFYFKSVGNGTLLVRNAATEYAEACPGSKMAFFGYSQGAQITSNNFCGMPLPWASYAGFTDISRIEEFSQPMSAELSKDVVSVVLFGDPSHRQDATYRHGNGTGSGIFWRSDISACEALSNRIRSYCDFGDPICSVGDNYTNAHLYYVVNYGTEVANFVVEQFKNETTPV